MNHAETQRSNWETATPERASALRSDLGKACLLGASASELEQLCIELGQPRFRGAQLARGIFGRRLESFASMTDIPKTLRQALDERFTIARPALAALQRSEDGTRKYRFESADGAAFEAVYIPEVAKERKTNTLCVSSQTGCALGCRFCFTASLKQHRDLAASEIIGQVVAAADDLAGDDPQARITNVVFMGMGEPLLNYAQVVRACRILMQPDGLGLSSRRITVSTAGIVPRIREIGTDLRTQLAVSLNATTDEVRSRIMPINRKWPLQDLLGAMRDYPLPKRRRITVEYVLLDGINDSDADARRLPQLLSGIPVKINLLRLNSHSRTELGPSPADRVQKFQEILLRAGLNAIVRTPRGRDIDAACGLLGEREH